jgi:hypothetical protein
MPADRPGVFKCLIRFFELIYNGDHRSLLLIDSAQNKGFSITLLKSSILIEHC